MNQAWDEINRLKVEHSLEKNEFEKALNDEKLKAYEKTKEKRDDKPFEIKIKPKKKEPRGIGIFRSNGSADGRIVYRGVFGGEYFKSGNSKAYLTDEQKQNQVEYFSD